MRTIRLVACIKLNGKGLPRWPAYRPDTEPYLEFGDTIRTGQHLLKTELDFQEKALKRRR